MGARRYEVRRIIDAEPSTVWDLLTDASTYAEWNDAVVSIEGPIRQGETIKLVSTVDPKRTFSLTVTEMVDPSRMVWTDGMPLGLFKGERTFEIVDRGGRSEFSMVEAFSGPLAGLITKAIPDLTDSFETFADGLKLASESRREAGSQ